MLSVAVVTLHAQNAMFQPTAFDVGFEFALYITRQNCALLCQIGADINTPNGEFFTAAGL